MYISLESLQDLETSLDSLVEKIIEILEIMMRTQLLHSAQLIMVL